MTITVGTPFLQALVASGRSILQGQNTSHHDMMMYSSDSAICGHASRCCCADGQRQQKVLYTLPGHAIAAGGLHAAQVQRLQKGVRLYLWVVAVIATSRSVLVSPDGRCSE